MSGEAGDIPGLDPAINRAPLRAVQVGSAVAWAADAGFGSDRGGRDLCRARSRHQQLPASGGAPDRRGLPRRRRVFPHRPAWRGHLGVRPLERAAIARAIAALAICRNKMKNKGVTRARLIATEACRAAQNGARVSRPCRRGIGSRARGHRSRNRSAARRHRLHAVDRSAGRRRRPVRYRRRFV